MQAEPWTDYRPYKVQAPGKKQMMRLIHEKQPATLPGKSKFKSDNYSYEADNSDYEGIESEQEMLNLKFEIPKLSGLPNFKNPEKVRETNRQDVYPGFTSQPKQHSVGSTSRFHTEQRAESGRYTQRYNEYKDNTNEYLNDNGYKPSEYNHNREYNKESQYNQGRKQHQIQGSNLKQGRYYNKESEYNQASEYKQGSNYNQGRVYNQDSEYNQGSKYNQGIVYSHGSEYNQGNKYNQGRYYTQGSEHNQGSKYKQSMYYNQDFKHTKGSEYYQGNNYNKDSDNKYIQDSEFMLQEKYPGYGMVDTMQEVKIKEEDTNYRQNRQPTIYEEKKTNVLKPVTNTVPISNPIVKDWEVIENEIENIKRQPINRMHRPSKLNDRQHQKVARDKPNQLKQAINQKTIYNHPKTDQRRVIPVIDKNSSHPTTPTINKDKPYRSSQEKSYLQPNKIKKKVSSKHDEFSFTEKSNKPTSNPKIFSLYPDTTSQASSHHQKVVPHIYRAKSPFNKKPKQSSLKTTPEKSPPLTRLSKLSTRNVQDSQEGESYNPGYSLAGPLGQGSLEAAVAAGAARYTAVRIYFKNFLLVFELILIQGTL